VPNYDLQLAHQLARIADELGPVLAPAAMRELLKSIAAAAVKLFGVDACSIACSARRATN
jgi:hypothetical protein